VFIASLSQDKNHDPLDSVNLDDVLKVAHSTGHNEYLCELRKFEMYCKVYLNSILSNVGLK